MYIILHRGIDINIWNPERILKGGIQMKKLQKPVSILLSVIMLLGIFTILPLGVNAEGQEEGMSYIQRSWNGTKIMYKEMF